MKIGLVAAPEFTTRLANSLVDKLPDYLSNRFNYDVSWEIEVVTDSLTAVAEDVDELLEDLEKRMKDSNWEYVFCLIDLPDFSEDNRPRLARVNLSRDVILLSIPAFGWSTQKRIETMIVQILQMAYDESESSDELESSSEEDKSEMPTNVYRDEDEENGEKYLYYFFRSKWLGIARILLGMAYANRPWRLMRSLRSVIAIAFTTGAYGLIFPTLWMLSHAFSITRLVALMLVSIGGVSMWIIYSNDLWERSTRRTDKKFKNLYNGATLLTLGIGVMSYYIVLLVLFLIFILFVVPPDLYSAQVGISGAPSIIDYFQLAWLTASIATAAGAIGVGVEDEESVRNIAYGYRQRKRYNEVERAREEENKEDSEE